MGAANPGGSGLLLNTALLFPKLDKCAIKMQSEPGGGLCSLLKKPKYPCPFLAEGHEASSPCAVVHSTVQSLHSGCNPHLESAALQN